MVIAIDVSFHRGFGNIIAVIFFSMLLLSSIPHIFPFQRFNIPISYVPTIIGFIAIVSIVSGIAYGTFLIIHFVNTYIKKAISNLNSNVKASHTC